MNILCWFGLHSWKDCRCERCNALRDEEHDWNGCCCKICAKTRDYYHDWNGCSCKNCAKTRDEQHDWNGCRCKICAKTRDEQHDWNGSLCKICGKNLDEEHDIEKQYALTLTVSELNQILNGYDVRTAVGYARKILVSKEVAKKAIPVVKICMEADSLVSQNNLDQAIVKYKAAIRKEPKYAIAHMAIGTVYYRKEDYANALKWTRIAAELDPLNSRIKNNLEIAEDNFKDAFSGSMADRSKPRPC
jgi:tetratricopeptide (TPR) repeat protein